MVFSGSLVSFYKSRKLTSVPLGAKWHPSQHVPVTGLEENRLSELGMLKEKEKKGFRSIPELELDTYVIAMKYSHPGTSR